MGSTKDAQSSGSWEAMETNLRSSFLWEEITAGFRLVVPRPLVVVVGSYSRLRH